MKYEIFSPLSIYEMGKRPNQEDTIFPNMGCATKDDRLFILCDGMGGHNNGEMASSVVCSTLSDYITTKTDRTKPFTDLMMTQAMAAVYNKLNALDKEDLSNDRKMGTTLVLLYFHAGGLMAAHIGDSRYYHIRPKSHEIIYQSKDHSLINDLYDAGELSLQEMKTTKIKNVVQRVIMPNQESPAKPDIVHIKNIRPDDWFFICSDGMLENMDNDELLNILCDDMMTDEQKRDCLIAATDNNKDNHSAHLIHIGSVVHEIIDENEPDDELQAREKNKLFLNKGNDIAEVVVETYPQVIMPAPDKKEEIRKYVPGPVPTPSPKNNNRNILAILLFVVVLVGGLVAFFLFKGDNKKEIQSAPMKIRYEEVPSGKSISREKQEQDDNLMVPAQSAKQRRPKKNVNVTNAPIDPSSVTVGRNAADNKSNASADNTKNDIRQGAKAIINGNSENKVTNNEGQITTDVHVDAFRNVSKKNETTDKDKDKNNKNDKKGVDD